MNADGSSGRPRAALDLAVSASALNAIRLEAIQGLLALRRVGIGVGGLLGGIEGEKIQVLGHVEIPCAHARGPAFLLTPDEIEHAAKLKAGAPLEVLGMYVSKTRGVADMAAPDLVLFDAICPEPGQIVLVVRPSTFEPARAALFMRLPDNSVRLECEWEMAPLAVDPELSEAEPEWVAAESAPGEAVPVQETAATMLAAEVPDAETQWERYAAAYHDVLPATIPEFAPEPASSLLFRDPEPPQESRTRNRFAYAAGTGALIAAALFSVARGHWTTPPPLALDVADDNGAIVFHWNRAAVAGENKGRLMVNDAGELSEFPLSRAGLSSGVFRYVRKSDRIVAELAVGDQEARAVFFGKGTTAHSGTTP